MSRYKRTLVWIALFCFVAGFTFTCDELTCTPPEDEDDESDDGDCGEKVPVNFYRNDLESSLYRDSESRKFCFMFMKHVTNVCALKHVDVDLSFWFERDYEIEEGVHVTAEI